MVIGIILIGSTVSEESYYFLDFDNNFFKKFLCFLSFYWRLLLTYLLVSITAGLMIANDVNLVEIVFST